VLVELTLEIVRLRAFPQRPSRLSCMFFWQEAMMTQRWAWPFGLYAMRVVTCETVFVADMGVLEYSSVAMTRADLLKHVHRYWQKPLQPRVAELLVEDAMEVVAAVDVACDV
jgi:hypothetical protein